MHIQAAKADFSKLASDFQQSNNKKKGNTESKSFQKTLSEYEELPVTVSYKSVAVMPVYRTHSESFSSQLFSKMVEQPPEQA